ncbi:MAG TPA: gamma-glutamylcyclotransferase family protein [Candidatus Binatia bacterium]|nr:gamma-glutamylcyclotransferase family protein [Candidatus Binatia bacterium]
MSATSPPARPVLVFAYGSNLCIERLAARTPSARVVATGALRGHRLCWHKRSRDGSGKCNALATGSQKDVVWGAVYELDPDDKAALDRFEGLGIDYFTKSVVIEGSSGQSWSAIVYVANPELLDEEARPYQWYKSLVTGGARHHGLPDDYCAMLEAIEAAQDPDVQRHHREMAVLAALRKDGR